MYTIQTNASGTRSMEISEKHLETIENIRSSNSLLTATELWTKPYLTN